MASEGSVTQWLAQLKAGDEEALGQIQGRYWKFLVKLADRQLDGAPRRVEDEEDVAQKAFWSFYNSVKDGRIPRLVNRSDLLSLLVSLPPGGLPIRSNTISGRNGAEVRYGANPRWISSIIRPPMPADWTL